VVRRRNGRFIIEAVAPGFSNTEVAALTEMEFLA
jgi:hypothetical protein